MESTQPQFISASEFAPANAKAARHNNLSSFREMFSILQSLETANWTSYFGETPKAIHIHLHEARLSIEAEKLVIVRDAAPLVCQEPLADDPRSNVLVGPLSHLPVLISSHPLSKLTPGTLDLES